jgi:hypothetical protein
MLNILGTHLYIWMQKIIFTKKTEISLPLSKDWHKQSTNHNLRKSHHFYPQSQNYYIINHFNTTICKQHYYLLTLIPQQQQQSISRVPNLFLSLSYYWMAIWNNWQYTCLPIFLSFIFLSLLPFLYLLLYISHK